MGLIDYSLLIAGESTTFTTEMSFSTEKRTMVVSEDIYKSTPRDIMGVSHDSMPKMMSTDKNLLVRSRHSCNDEKIVDSSSKQKLDILAKSH